LRTPRGWRSLVGLLRATVSAKGALRRERPDAVFSTGGYSAAPVVHAARSLKIPFVIHEANSVPGRTNLMFAPQAHAFTCVFKATERYAKAATRTGQPVRRALRDAAAGRAPSEPTVLVVGGSQGSAFLNGIVPKAARELPEVRFIHAAGKANYDQVASEIEPLKLGDRYRLVPYLETDELMSAYQQATIAVARSGGTLAEFAAFRLPSVLVPLPQSADDHQRHNALEFVEMKAASLFEQADRPVTATEVDNLAGMIRQWVDHPERQSRAAEALAAWDLPLATESIVERIEAAGARR